ncbi:ABC-2 type transport system ATP-binding protein [Paenibacillus sp. DS2015]
MFGFLGPNGAGKTTTIRMMTGLIQVTEGEILINKMNISERKKDIHAQIGIVFELLNLYLRSSIKDNLKLFADLYGVSNIRLIEVMESLQLQEKQDVKVGTWKQSVLIARALLHSPKVLFLDEPTSGLDPNTASLIRHYIKQCKQRGTTIVLTTHDMQEADELSDRVGIMYKGKLVAMDHPRQLKSIYGSKEIHIEYNEDGLVVSKRLLADEEDTVEQIYRIMLDNQTISMHTKEASLADVFARLTGSELS